MKKSITRSLMLLGMTTVSMMANAQQRQLNMEIHIDKPADAAVFQSGETFPLTVSITNLGPDNLVAGDSLFVILPSGEGTWGTLPDAIPIDSNFVLFSEELTLPVVETSMSIDVCVQLVDDPTTQIRLSGSPISVSYIDPVPGNNVACHTLTIEPEPTSIAGQNDPELDLQPYPNPAKNLLHIPVDPTLSGMVQIRIMDISGRMVFNEHISQPAAQSVEVNVAQLQEGVYILERQQGGTRSTGKFSILR